MMETVIETHPAKSEEGEQFDLYDMSGNVWEVWDSYSRKYDSTTAILFMLTSSKGRVFGWGLGRQCGIRVFPTAPGSMPPTVTSGFSFSRT